MLLRLAATLLLLSLIPTHAAERTPQEQIHSDISKREISIQSNFTGIEILIFGSIDVAGAKQEGGPYDVIAVIRGPSRSLVVRRKVKVAGIWVNGPGETFIRVPEFYAVVSSRPLRAIASDETLKEHGIGLASLSFGRRRTDDSEEQAFRSAMIRLKTRETLFQQHDDGVTFVGGSLFRATVALPVNVPVGRYTADVYLFRNGVMLSKSQGSLQVTKVGFERVIFMLAFKRPFIYGFLAVIIAVFAGLAGWFVFRRD